MLAENLDSQNTAPLLVWFVPAMQLYDLRIVVHGQSLMFGWSEPFPAA